jgi:hypothetical protein
MAEVVTPLRPLHVVFRSTSAGHVCQTFKDLI